MNAGRAAAGTRRLRPVGAPRCAKPQAGSPWDLAGPPNRPMKRNSRCSVLWHARCYGSGAPRWSRGLLGARSRSRFRCSESLGSRSAVPVRQAACPPLRPGLQRSCQSTPRSGPLISSVRRPYGLRCKRFPQVGVEHLSRIGAGWLPGRRPSSAPHEHVIGTLRRSRRLLVSRLWGAVWRWCAGDLGCRRYDANDAPSSAFDIVLGDHRHAGPVAVTPRASSAQLAGTPLRGLPPAIFAGTRRAGARPRAPLLPQPPAAASFTVLADQQSSPSASFSARGSPPRGRRPARVGVGGRRRFLVRARRPPRRLAVAVRAGRWTGGCSTCWFMYPIV